MHILFQEVQDGLGIEENIFTACEKAINELEKLVKDLHTTFSGINAFITADHGFFYKRGKVESYEKTTKTSNATKQKTRYFEH